ncbi:unnamed protein product [Gongylonema pulchrum]|uniref:Methyltransferase-like protein 22 n=1 Tax=Gongylonema pulchrum TaxID=637853 RepID=A0A183DC34_9BILA|nr:unnamed protein product [Gongylonema pulchrum]
MPVLQGLDWNQPHTDVDSVLDGIETLHYILAADVFYDITVFKSIVQTIALLLRRFQKAICIFAYEERE